MLLEIANILISMVEMGIDLYIFARLSDGIHRRFLVPISVIVGTIVMIGMDELQINDTLKLMTGIVLVSVLSYLSFYLQIYNTLQGALLMLIGTMVSELLAAGILMLVFGTDFIGKFAIKSELQMQGAVFSKLILFSSVIIITNIMRRRDKRYSWREIALLMIQISTCVLTLILTFEISIKGEDVLNISPIYFCFMAIGCILVYFVSYYITTGYFQSKREKIELLEMDAMARQKMQYYEHKLDTQLQVRRMYHDMKNHMLALRELQKSSSEEWNTYMDAMELQMRPYADIFHTGNDVLDALLYEKSKIAEESDIVFETNIESNCIKHIPNIALCTILGNGLDNALEAVEEVESRERRIFVSITSDETRLHILIQNNYDGNLVRKNGELITRKKEKENHGIGLKSISQAVKDCEGNLSLEEKNNIFEMYVILPNVDKNI